MRLRGDHTQVGVERRERVVGDLGPGVRDRADQGRLAGIRLAEQADVRQHLELEAQATVVTGGAVGLLPGGAVDRALEAGIAQPVPAALGHQQLGTGLDHLADHLAGVLVVHHCAERHVDMQIVALPAGHVAPGAISAALGLVMALETEVGQRVEVDVTDQVDRAAIAAVTPVGTTVGHVFLAAKAHHAIAAVTGFDLDGGFIDKFHDTFPAIVLDGPQTRKPRSQAGLGQRLPASHADRQLTSGRRYAGSMLTKRRLFGPLVSNFTWPSVRANRV